ncbi:DUF2339 domain-containing protein [Terrimonas pollutisoli]|uniref:DUF2339 domain-containing protein n=1 Tax=Terrimonas pollutisoli TaxID=3034147 RepID=UPI0023ECCBF5|nr:DUF2339 domain-containing protein [Terrimonas sp. H1YJ31]
MDVNPVAEISKSPGEKPSLPEIPATKERIITEEESSAPISEQLKRPVPQPALVNKQNLWDKWMQNNPDLEKFIGENLANKIGIAVLVLGIAFFVKYAIDKNWINEAGRVVIGLASGGTLIGLAHYIRNSYRSFSSVLVGGGLAIFYFTMAFAFHEYHLMSQQAAFAIMILITAFAIILSLLYNRLEVAILATIGGFITPFLVSTGHGNYIALFTYLCILNTGLMVLAWFKRWPAINFVALFFTVFIYGGWLTKEILSGDEGQFPYRNAILFATIFYVLFVIMNIINTLRLKNSFKGFDFIVVLSVNFLYYTAGLLILQYWNAGEYKGLFTSALGVINLALAWLFFRNTKVDKNFVYLLIGLTLTFISLAAPVQLKGNHITLFWAAEAVVLFWLYQRSRISLIKIASLAVTLLMFISLLMDWSQVYSASRVQIPIITNKGFTTAIVAAAALLVYYLLMRKEADSFYLNSLTNKSVRTILLAGGILLGYLAGVLEIWYQFGTRIPKTEIYAVYLQLYSFAFAIALLLVFKKANNLPLLRFVLTILCFALYLINLNTNYEILNNILETGDNKVHFTAHWISAVLLLKLLYDLVIYFRKNHTSWVSYERSFTWLATISIILLLSVETHHIILWLNYAKQNDWAYWQNLYFKAGLSILWGICSFIMMWLGMKYKFRTLRIISLTLFSVTIVKLFFYDISNIPPGGKIAAFILLGVLLLTVSFMYQRLKKIIIDDTQETK